MTFCFLGPFVSVTSMRDLHSPFPSPPIGRSLGLCEQQEAGLTTLGCYSLSSPGGQLVWFPGDGIVLQI